MTTRKQKTDELRQYEHCHCSHTACDALQLTEKRFVDLGTFGVEGFCFDPYCSNTGGLSYLNTGDRYQLTIVFNSENERFSIDSYGDFIERKQLR